jgi:hypothetical protein
MIKKILIVMMLASLSLGPIGPAHAVDECDGTQSKTLDISEKFSLCWTMGTEHDLANYILYDNGTVLDTMSVGDSCGVGPYCESSYYSLDATGDHTLTVVAQDSTGNKSQHSDPVKVTIVDRPPKKPSGCSIR